MQFKSIKASEYHTSIIVSSDKRSMYLGYHINIVLSAWAQIFGRLVISSETLPELWSRGEKVLTKKIIRKVGEKTDFVSIGEISIQENAYLWSIICYENDYFDTKLN